MNPNLIILHLSLISNISNAVINTLIARAPQGFDWRTVYTLLPSDFVRLFGLTTEQAVTIVKGLADTTWYDQEVALLAQHAISWMTILDDHYPQMLKTIPGPPAVLYWHGAPLQETDNKIAVIGARKANSYAQRNIDTIVPALVAHDWVIVSGGAAGADSMAHRAALHAHGKTIAVLGSGLLKPYPTSNKKLFNDIIASGGTVLSEFPLMMDALAHNFPRRNRIIAGLSKGCVVAQAATKSGASITAHYALEYGRDVFAIPGPIDDELSAGCHQLIQEGAKLTTCAADILSEYGEFEPAKLRQNSLFTAAPLYEPASTEGIVMRCCAQAMTTDDLLAATGLSLSALNAVLFDLQLAGHITQQFNGQWVTV